MVEKVLLRALEEREIEKDIIFHSDQWIQYTSVGVREILSKNQMIQSMSRKGNCYDNAVAESFFHTLKSEHISFEKLKTRREAKLSIFEYIEIFYNRKRLL